MHLGGEELPQFMSEDSTRTKGKFDNKLIVTVELRRFLKNKQQ